MSLVSPRPNRPQKFFTRILFIIYQGLCAWDTDDQAIGNQQSQNQWKKRATSPDEELRDMFSQLVINQHELILPKKPCFKATQRRRPKSSSTGATRSKSARSGAQTTLNSSTNSNNINANKPKTHRSISTISSQVYT